MSGEQTSAWLDELTALREAATPGPWFAWDRGVGWNLATEDPTGVDHLPGRPYLLPEGIRTDLARATDAALIVAAVNALPRLVAAVRAALKVADDWQGWPASAMAATEMADTLREEIAAALAAGRPDGTAEKARQR